MIEFIGVEKIFNSGSANETHALKAFDLKIEEGDFIVLIGANGSGKSTILNLLGGDIFCTDGEIKINGRSVAALPQHKRSRWVARVFQDPNKGSAANLTVIENFRLAALRDKSKSLNLGLTKDFRVQVRDRIAELGMGLENKLDSKMVELSGGQRQALTLIMAVMSDCEVLLMDEPTAALDPRSSEQLLKAAENVIKMYNLTTIFVTHHLKDAHKFGNRLVQMQEGNIIRELNPTEKSETPLTEYFKWFA